MENLNTKNEEQQILNHSPFAFYGYAWNKVWKYFLELLLVSIVSFLLILPTIGLDKDNSYLFAENSFRVDLFIISFEGYGAYLLLAIAYMLLFQWPLEYGISFVHLKAVRNEKIKVQNMFESFNNYWNTVFANLLVAVIIGFGIMLLVFPGIFFACKLAFVPYLIVDKKMEAVEAVKSSWQLTKGYGFVIFFTGFFAIFLFLFGLLAFLVGVVVSLIWIRLSFASIYANSEKEAAQFIHNDMQ